MHVMLCPGYASCLISIYHFLDSPQKILPITVEVVSAHPMAAKRKRPGAADRRGSEYLETTEQHEYLQLATKDVQKIIPTSPHIYLDKSQFGWPAISSNKKAELLASSILPRWHLSRRILQTTRSPPRSKRLGSHFPQCDRQPRSIWSTTRRTRRGSLQPLQGLCSRSIDA